MTFRIHLTWTAALRREPETGMGFQIIESPISKSTAPLILLNAEFAVPIGRPDRVKEAVGLEEILTTILSTPATRGGVRVLTRAAAIAHGYLATEVKGGTMPADQAPAADSLPKEPFRRYSAFANDIRINADGSVTAGTYATTLLDGYLYAKTGMEAVRRYALPNPDPAVNVFELVPPGVIGVRRGTVAPAYGQPGGGVEIILINGAPAGSLARRSTIPPGT